MEVTLGTVELLKVASLVSRVVGAKPNLPILSNLLLEATKTGLQVSATNLETSIKMFVAAKVSQEGRTTVPARVLVDFISTGKGDKTQLKLVKENLEINNGETEASMATISALEFPPLPVPPKGQGASLPAEVVTEAINQVAFAASPDEGRPVLTGVLLRGEGKKLVLVATDGYRLVKKEIPVSIDLPDLIIPARSLVEVAKLLAETAEGKVVVATLEGANQVIFTTDGFEIASRVLEGSFPNFGQIIPEKFACETEVKKEALVLAVRQVATFSRDLGNVIQVETKGKGELLFTAKTAQLGQAESRLAAPIKGEQLKIAFNAKYLLEGLNVIDDATVALKFSGTTSPTLIRAHGNENLTYIVMPVRIQS